MRVGVILGVSVGVGVVLGEAGDGNGTWIKKKKMWDQFQMFPLLALATWMVNNDVEASQGGLL